MANYKLPIITLLMSATLTENTKGCCQKPTNPPPGPAPKPTWKCESKTDGWVAFTLEAFWVNRETSETKIQVTKNIGRGSLEACLEHASGNTEMMGATNITLSADGQIRSSSLAEAIKASMKSYTDYKSALPVQDEVPKTFTSVQHQLQYKGCKDLIISTDILADSPTTTEPKVCVMVATAKRYVKGLIVTRTTEGPYEAVPDVRERQFILITEIDNENVDFFFALAYTTDKTQGLTDITFTNDDLAGHENQLIYRRGTAHYLRLIRESGGKKLTEVINSVRERDGYTTIRLPQIPKNPTTYFQWKTESG